MAAEQMFRDPNTGTMVPLIPMRVVDGDARYAKTSGQAMTGNISGVAPTVASHAPTRSYAEATLELPAGAVFPFGGTSIPAGWPFLLCQGQAVNRTTYADLFTAISTKYGVGDGSTTFNVPDLRGRTPVSINTGDSSFDAVNDKGGAKTVTLSKAAMPGNDTGTLELHNAAGPTILFSADGDAFTDGGGHGSQYHSHENPNTAAYSHGTTGFSLGFGNGAHNNLQWYVALHFIIKF